MSAVRPTVRPWGVDVVRVATLPAIAAVVTARDAGAAAATTAALLRWSGAWKVLAVVNVSVATGSAPAPPESRTCPAALEASATSARELGVTSAIAVAVHHGLRGGVPDEGPAGRGGAGDELIARRRD